MGISECLQKGKALFLEHCIRRGVRHVTKYCREKRFISVRNAEEAFI